MRQHRFERSNPVRLNRSARAGSGVMAAASSERNRQQALLGHLQAENAQLRDTAVRLALEIQHLRRSAR